MPVSSILLQGLTFKLTGETLLPVDAGCPHHGYISALLFKVLKKWSYSRYCRDMGRVVVNCPVHGIKVGGEGWLERWHDSGSSVTGREGM